MEAIKIEDYDRMRYKEANKNQNQRNDLRNTTKPKSIKITSISNNIDRGFDDRNLVKEHNDKLRFNKAHSNLEHKQIYQSNM